MAHMPIAKEKQTFKVTGHEDFKAQQGFGEDEGSVKMMGLMMVEGSGQEGMDMSAPPPAAEIKKEGATNASPFEVQAHVKPGPAKVGSNQIDFTLVDSTTKKPAPKVKLQAQVFMTSMDMGTEEPKVEEVSPGHYRVKADFTMAGPWAVRIKSLPKTEKEPSKAWENVLNFDVRRAK